MLIQGWAMKRENLKTLKRNRHVNFFICLLVINEKHMNSHFVLCQFENLCFENNALKMASVSTHSSSRDLEGDIPWPPRSPNLTPCDYFFWGYPKTKVFETKPRTI